MVFTFSALIPVRSIQAALAALASRS